MAYSQNDPAWKNILLGFNTSNLWTIGAAGCYVTAIANVCKWAGNDMNPHQINNICKDRNWFVNGGEIDRDDIPALLCSNLGFVGRTNWSGPTDINFFNDASSTDVAYIIKIDASLKSGIQTHFVMVWAKPDANDLTIEDSWDGVRKALSHYGKPSAVILSAMKFVKVAPPAPEPPPPPAPEPVYVSPPILPPPPSPPAPLPAPVTVPTSTVKYPIEVPLETYGNKTDAINRTNATGVIAPGASWYIFYQLDGVNNITQFPGKTSATWINPADNVVVPAPVIPSPDAAASTWKNTLTPLQKSGKSIRFRIVRDMYVHDLANKSADGVELNESTDDMDTWLPVRYWVVKSNMVYLMPFLAADKKQEHFYGIPTTDISTGLPNLESEFYTVGKTEDEREYRREQGRLTVEDQVYYVNRWFAKKVSDGIRFLDGIISLKPKK